MFCRPWAGELATTPLNHTIILLAQLDLTQNYIYYITVVVRSVTYDSPVSLSRHIFTILLYMVYNHITLIKLSVILTLQFQDLRV